MRMRAVLGSIFASTAVLIVGWQAGGAVLSSEAAATSQPQGSGSSTSGAAAPATSSSDGTATAPVPDAASTGSAPESASAAADGTYTGSLVQTRFGSVQVSVTIAGGAITDVAALKLTDHESRSVQISNRAAPVLRGEVLAAQSANVSNVSGATYTTEAYLESLQAALDQAGF